MQVDCMYCMCSHRPIMLNRRIELVTYGQPIIEMCSIVNQSTASRSDQSEVAISGRIANQKSGKKRTKQKGGYKEKQPINSIDKSLHFKKKQRQESRDSHFIRHVT